MSWKTFVMLIAVAVIAGVVTYYLTVKREHYA